LGENGALRPDRTAASFEWQTEESVTIIPAKRGIHPQFYVRVKDLDSLFRGNDDSSWLFQMRPAAQSGVCRAGLRGGGKENLKLA